MANDSAGTTDDTLGAPNPSLADATQAEALNNDFIERQQRLLCTDPDAFYRRQGEDALAATACRTCGGRCSTSPPRPACASASPARSTAT